jgi:DNA primase
MLFHGKNIDPVDLWSNFTEIAENRRGDAPFISGLWCPNPEHSNSRKPGPFQINVTQPTVHCFAECGISGSYEHAVAVIKGLTNERTGKPNQYAARKIILKLTRGVDHVAAGRARKTVGRKRKSASAIQSLDFSTFIPPLGRDYLEGRGIDASSIARWGLGWDENDRRIVIPAHDERDVLRFLIKRAVRPKDWPKYLYTEHSDKTSLLFGACMLDRERVRSDGLIVVEGSLDTILQHQHGFANTVGQLGSKLSRKQRDIIARYRPRRIYLFYDKDSAGARAISHAAAILRAYPIFVCLYPKGKNDPGELSRKEAERIVDRAIPLAKFLRKVRNVMPEMSAKKKEANVA